MAAVAELSAVDPDALRPGSWRITPEPRHTTLAEHGPRPVIGPPADAKPPAREAHMSPWVFVPRDLAFLAQVGREVHANRFLQGKKGKLILHILGASLAHIWGEDVSGKSISMRAAAASRLAFSDMAYAAYCRRSEEDCGIIDLEGLELTCPVCAGVDTTPEVDIGNVGVTVYDEQPRAVYRLKKPWAHRGKKVLEVTLRPPALARGVEPWTDADWTIDTLRDLHLVAASIMEVNGAADIVQVADLTRRDSATGRAMSDVDFAKLKLVLVQLGGGPSDAVAWACPTKGCAGKTMLPLDWSIDFFGPSPA